ncbi:hypothetical protein, partial [Streptomyces pseudogriseolus]|uniref:hypothetical protein n=1 Tax=Streptomyces pseudogriseolus TaxID=36817 RepID=UPI0036C3A051
IHPPTIDINTCFVGGCVSCFYETGWVNPEQIVQTRAGGRARAVPAGRAATTAGAGGVSAPSRRIVFMDE